MSDENGAEAQRLDQETEAEAAAEAQSAAPEDAGPAGAQPAADVAANAGGVNAVLKTTQERVVELLEVTERATGDILDSANSEAERLVRETHSRAERLAEERMDRIATLTEDVMAKASSLDREVDQLRSLMRESVKTLAGDLGIASRSTQATPVFSNDVVVGSQISGEHSQAVRVLASQLLAAGNSADEVEDRLREEFGIDDPRALIDDLKPVGAA